MDKYNPHGSNSRTMGIIMSWIILEGLDRTGKSSVADHYKSQGYEIVHMSAPDKKYREPGYAGPSYLDDLLELVMEHDGKDVIWDRSWYGEFVWPHTYGRPPMLSEEDLEVLQEFEERNEAKKILMVDPDMQAHWQRCVDNKEPLTFSQFKIATSLFTKLAHKHNFVPMQLGDFKLEAKNTKPTSAASQQTEPVAPKQSGTTSSPPSASSSSSTKKEEKGELEKLEQANAIRDVLSKRVLKQKGGAFDKLEEEIKDFLHAQLSNIFREKAPDDAFSKEEVAILKLYCKRLKETAATTTTRKK